ncbi:MAG: UDP-N-acetylglucosamine 1-carboxyvinyltransferase [Elusimicrobia bacterium GWF2_52_66]|nr:MAG: UDP-N-acetylglucosamine 1-carboxyvinyltransferase [Elusimicrobia bacterium GWA2_51_34]OGR87285.1 MAG: UDP-N-acetylglucosamine 1-carboxyvinyltransferase [Elusimicrobia bacterium GWF2_52_66]HAF95018.1 UDP-N-acetylglucosamine 1-carboxyvinyltransferase [Elusimicrobiota bacterium]HCE97966.1 UDP-N-acetylglucosamine 1-carboxyvinyltransferase [Elusimicrobiota bacterium]
MDNFIIRGGKQLNGEIKISGSKNAVLPILAATLLTGERCEITNVPELRDIRSTFELLNYLGKNCFFGYGDFVAEERGPLKLHAPYDLVRKMRASMLVAGPLLARFKKTVFSLPGGCSIGLRPIDIHLQAFKKLGAEISREKGNVVLTAKKLKAARVKFRFPSVGATENLMMCAALIEGRTVLENCAREPEIADLAAVLKKMGARIKGEGTATIEVAGTARLKGFKHSVMADRIETGTFMLACAAAGGRVRLSGVIPKTVDALTRHLRLAGVEVSVFKDAIGINSSGSRPRPVSIITRPYPGFPTDLQAPWMAFMSRARGLCSVNERIFENRFMHAAELGRLGADISVAGKKARIQGVETLLGAPVMASDLRAGAALVIAALVAGGKTLVRRIYHIDRGYEKFEDKLRRLGADIERVKN